MNIVQCVAWCRHEAERLRQVELERQRQKALEIERERERERQRLALQWEAQAREAERKRKEEWARKRLAELEEQRKMERDGLHTIQHQHQELVDMLAKLDMEKGGLCVRLEQQRVLCKQLASTLDSLRQVTPPHRLRVTNLVAELTVSAALHACVYLLLALVSLVGTETNVGHT